MTKNIKLDFLYERGTNKTTIYVWSYMDILETIIMEGTLSKFVKKKIIDQMKKKYLKDKK